MDKNLQVMAAIIMLILAPIALYTSPFYIGLLQQYHLYTHAQLGRLFSYEVFTGTAISLSAILWIKRCRWRLFALLAGIGMLLGNILSLHFVNDFYYLILARILVGISLGVLSPIVCAVIGNMPHPNRNFAIVIGGQALVATCAFFLLPMVAFYYKAYSIIGMFIIASGLICLLSLLLPKAATVKEFSQKPNSENKSKLPIWGLLGIICIFTGFASLYTFMERLGVNSGLSQQFVGTTLGIAAASGILGSIISAWLGMRIVNYFWPMLAACLVHILVALILALAFSPLTFIIAIISFLTFWTFWIPFQMSSVALADSSHGQYTAIITGCQGLGFALGPFLVSRWITPEYYLPVFITMLLFETLGLLLFIPITLMVKKVRA